VGHSFGADVAAELATHSDCVTGCVVIGQAPDYSYSKLPPGFITQVLPIGWLHRLTPKAALRFAVRSGFAPDFRVSASSEDDDAFIRDISAMDPAMYKVVLETRPKRLAKLPLEVQIRESGVAALDIHGDKDQMWDWRKTVARFEAAGIRVETIAGAGHSPNVERPVTVARLIRQFATGPTPRPQPPA
jgi:pimeloyl-ACP methyl ester carboxylesterase